jgi:hypothetical protein
MVMAAETTPGHLDVPNNDERVALSPRGVRTEGDIVFQRETYA